MLATIMRRGRTWPWIRMRPFLAQFSEPVWSGRLPSWADFITTTPVFRFSVHTGNGLLTSQVTLVLQSFRVGHKLWVDRRCADRCTDRTHRFTDGTQESRARVLHKMPSIG